MSLLNHVFTSFGGGSSEPPSHASHFPGTINGFLAAPTKEQRTFSSANKIGRTKNHLL